MQDLVRQALDHWPGPWALVDDLRLERLRLRAELVLVTDRAVLVFGRDRAAVEGAALSLADFHAGCHGLPVIPVAMLQGQRVVAQDPLGFPGASPVVSSSRLLLPGLLAVVRRFPVLPGFDPARWTEAAYRPVPALMQAAAQLYARHGAAALALANTGRGTLVRTQAAVAAAVAATRADGGKRVIFVTGEPGAGKTLCGLHLAFTPGGDAAFLTGNPALVHVLRAALVRDAATRGLQPRAARQRVHAVIQPLHGFRDQYAASGIPPDEVLVIDEAQRCWTAEYAVRKTVNKAIRLRDSEPAHILDAMARRTGWCAVVCLLGGGQEIHAGEGGLAEWGKALAGRPDWQVSAPPEALTAPDPRQRLPNLPGLLTCSDLHLADPVRSFQSPRQVGWAGALLAADRVAAAELAGAGLNVQVTRSLDAMRAALRAGPGRAGLVASAGGRRLRAEGLGGLLWHQDEDAVARWFLDDWPDIRGSDALEVAATEFGVQGLELDQVGVCWDLDLAFDEDRSDWTAHAFRATAWTGPLTGDARSNRLNAYRVLLTRGRRRTVIWVPRGDERDPTRNPARYDAVARVLLRFGAVPLEPAAPVPQPLPEAALL